MCTYTHMYTLYCYCLYMYMYMYDCRATCTHYCNITIIILRYMYMYMYSVYERRATLRGGREGDCVSPLPLRFVLSNSNTILMPSGLASSYTKIIWVWTCNSRCILGVRVQKGTFKIVSLYNITGLFEFGFYLHLHINTARVHMYEIILY
jgi:hypothetical protein